MNINAKQISSKVRNTIHSATVSKNMHAYETVTFCYILAFMGGFLDAYSYIDRNGIFVASQSANFVLFAVELINYNFYNAFYKLCPITIFICATIWVRCMQKNYKNRMDNRTTIIILMSKLTIFSLIGLFDNEKYFLITNLVLSFITAVQFSTFTKITHFQFSSIVVTGNLRSLSEALYFSLFSPTPINRKFQQKRAIIFASLISFFVLGAVVGAIFTYQFYTKAILFCAILVLINLIITKIDMQKKLIHKAI